MLTNRRSTMMVPPNRMPSWHPQSKPPPLHASPPLTFSPDPLTSRTPSILTSTTPTLPGHRIHRALGSVHGTTSALRKDTKSFFKSLASSFSGTWGEPKALTSLIYQARDQAVERMVKEAVARGANAVIGVSVSVDEVLGCVVVSVGGTACWVERGGEKGEGKEGKRDSALDGEGPFVG
ncbi:DUF74-domain-containing protein [Pyrenochaeta sp. DS3sAY3a]|nr:DUF74-domain-containing protein [Pyrenochaeta sp. DS3sAY3a]